MKKINLLLLSLLFTNIFSQEIREKEIKSEVNEVTVFINGAQVVRKKTVELLQGKTVIKFVNLSPFIESKSIQVKAEGNITILSANYQQQLNENPTKNQEISDLETKIADLDLKLTTENAYLQIINEELEFLQNNRNIGGKVQELNITNLKATSEFYGTKLKTLKLSEIQRINTIKDLEKQKKVFQDQIKKISSQRGNPTGEIIVKVDAKSNTSYSFNVSYVVSNAGWYPSYDIRVKNINEPVQLIYKANIKQDTKDDWNNVKLKLSSSNPNTSGIAPELKTYFLNYYTHAPVYNKFLSNVSGRVLDNDKYGMPGVTVRIEGTTIGTVTDINGYYSISIPQNADYVKFSFIGYYDQILPISNSTMNVVMQEDARDLEEVKVIGYGSRKKNYDALQGIAAGVQIEKPIKIRGTSSSLSIPTIQNENQTTLDFEIKIPYTIKSDNKNYTVDMDAYELPAIYQYYCVPKIQKNAFLIANIIDWEKYNLLEGEANIFFENTYIGNTILDIKNASDTLEISLGIDKSISINREKIKDFSTKQFLGTKKEETRTWRNTIKNNKSQSVNIIILDQVPLSTQEDIEVNVQNISGAKHFIETGEIKWEYKIDPNDKKTTELKYSVKYSKYRNLIIE